MDVRIEPEPAREEREAIEIALRPLLSRGMVPPAYTSAWRTAGLRESVASEGYAGARPRSSFGATRT